MEDSVSMFLGGDVMTGRGIDQIMPVPSDPVIYESYVKNAKDYVTLAMNENGPIQVPVSYDYIWGYALPLLNWKQPDARIINLETSITVSDNIWKNKGIHYRMHPKNTACLKAADVDCCVLANNHVLDWDFEGLTETLLTLQKENIQYVGAGADLGEAAKPAVIDVNSRNRILVFAFGLQSSGIPKRWMALPNEPGVNLIPELSSASVHAIKNEVKKYKKEGDVVVFSVHWGGNWGYRISDKERQFAHELIDVADVDIIHGHSSHHFKEIEIYNDKLILYGCGDLINDYEGIKGYEMYRDDLGFLYFPEVDAKTGKTLKLSLLPTRLKQLHLTKPTPEDMEWMTETLNRESASLQVEKTQQKENIFLEWENETAMSELKK